MPGDPFDIELPPHAPLRRAAVMVARPLLRRVLALETLHRLYRQADTNDFPGSALRVLDIRVVCPDAELALVPANGPLVVVANHPRGGVDGLALLTLLRRRRTDVRLLANHLLAKIPELRPLCFFVDPFGGRGASGRSHAGLRAARAWLAGGGAVIVFPAGAVAPSCDERGQPVDAPWTTTAARLARASGAQILPAFVGGRNRPVFYRAGRAHAWLRTLLLPRELLAARGSTVRIRCAAPFSAVPGDDLRLTARMRAAVASCRTAPLLPLLRRFPVPQEPPVGLQAAVAREVGRLPAAARLLESGGFEVFCVAAPHIPAVLHEIGRLRELTFRAAGEGTGRDVDLDRFDEHYLHLFSWDTRRQTIVGAYRLGRADLIAEQQGIAGLYTRTLFKYDRTLIDRLSPALELGRSFVRVEYQRHHAALLHLWRGIGRFIIRHPQYRRLFGAVSISARYPDESRRLLMSFLEQNHYAHDLAALVRGVDEERTSRLVRMATAAAAEREHPRPPGARSAAPAGVIDMPVLLRQYLKLNARAVAFSVDPAFGDALDALMVVDLADVAPAVLRRYFGDRDAAALVPPRGDSHAPSHAA